MTTPTPLPHAVAIQLCSDFDEASYRCGDPNHSPISCTCMKLVMTWRTMQRDLAAAQERAEKAEAERDELKRHAEAMAEELQWIACRYDDSKSTRECAADAYEMKSAAAQALHAYRATQEKS